LPFEQLAHPLLQLRLQLLGALLIPPRAVGPLVALEGTSGLLDRVLQGGVTSERGHGDAGEDDEGVEGGLLLADLHLFAARAVGFALLVHEGPRGQARTDGLHQLPTVDPAVELLFARSLVILAAEAELDRVLLVVGRRLQGDLQPLLNAEALGLGGVQHRRGDDAVVVGDAA
jgi:hypothetical protein